MATLALTLAFVFGLLVLVYQHGAFDFLGLRFLCVYVVCVLCVCVRVSVVCVCVFVCVSGVCCVLYVVYCVCVGRLEYVRPFLWGVTLSACS